MAAWPGTIPFRAYNDVWEEAPENAIVEFAPEAGPPKRRKRISDPGDVVVIQAILDTTQRAAFLTFFQVDCDWGALTFTADHPITGVSTEWQWAGNPPWRMRYSNTKFWMSGAVRRIP